MKTEKLSKTEQKVNRETLPSVAKWMRMTQSQVLDKFQGIPGSYTEGVDQQRFVYIPGTRKDRVLLVAHADTVWYWLESGGDSGIKLKYENGIITSALEDTKFIVSYKNSKKTDAVKGVGTGADDRAGCHILWQLRNLGHSLLITSGEEQGCISTNRMMDDKWWSDELNNTHQFVIQFDRRGSNDIVFYDVASPEFAEYAKKETGYEWAEGTTTDIRHICKSISGLNISVGYYDEHFSAERLNVKEHMRTLETCRTWLSKENLPKFVLDPKNSFSIPRPKIYRDRKGRYGGLVQYNDDYASNIIPYRTSGLYSDNQISIPSDKADFGLVTCPSCKHRMSQEIWLRSMFMCDKCGNVA